MLLVHQIETRRNNYEKDILPHIVCADGFDLDPAVVNGTCQRLGESRFAYTIENGEVTITGSNRPIDDVITIPETIEGYPVTTIANGAFLFKTTIHSITIPATVTRNGKDAFNLCNSLENVYISDLSAWCKIDFDGTQATPMCYASNLYLNNELLTDVTIPEDITQLIDYTFFSCESLTSVTVPETVRNVGFRKESPKFG